MPSIYLLANYSICSGWIAASIRQNSHLLAANGISLIPFASANEEYIPSNSDFLYRDAKSSVSQELRKKIKSAHISLATGYSILFVAQSSDINTQENFYTFIQRYFPIKKYTVIPILVIGKPSIIMEHWWRTTPKSTPTVYTDEYLKYALNIHKIALSAQSMWGEEKTKFISSLHENISPQTTAETLGNIFEILGINEAPKLSDALPVQQFINTATAARLVEARQVRHNDWPRLDNAAYMATVQDCEQAWGPEPTSPLACRRMLLAQGGESQKLLENLLGLAAHALDAPDWYGTLPEADASAPLAPDRLETFAEKLPAHVRHTLRQRFAHDRQFLTRDQKDLSSLLDRAAGADFATLAAGEEAPLLTVLTMTRNHEKYIGACIESVLAQKTDFPVRHLILDHYSTDGTPKIIETYARRYPSIRPVLLNNYYYIYNNVEDLFIRCRSEYAALCDGDDYFTEPLKLQKQVDFLKNHPRCSLCFHLVGVTFEDGHPPTIFPPPSMLPRGIKEEYYLSDLLNGNLIQTNTVVYKWRFRDGLPDWFRHDLCPGDWYWHLLHAECGKIGFIPEVMSIYRRHPNSLYKDSFHNRIEHRKRMGMAELETYMAVNDHFHDRYFLPLARLANGVFSDFLEIYVTKNDKTLFDEASQKYPKFAKHFLDNLKITRKINNT